MRGFSCTMALARLARPERCPLYSFSCSFSSCRGGAAQRPSPGVRHRAPRRGSVRTQRAHPGKCRSTPGPPLRPEIPRPSNCPQNAVGLGTQPGQAPGPTDTPSFPVRTEGLPQPPSHVASFRGGPHSVLSPLPSPVLLWKITHLLPSSHSEGWRTVQGCRSGSTRKLPAPLPPPPGPMLPLRGPPGPQASLTPTPDHRSSRRQGLPASSLLHHSLPQGT